ncbi:MAG: right-handed parallel beta-helix repeat-containing protein, partial [Sphaerochaetaceae bacterium]|nr:right-handed parallel beta-helix repeat-containing protein [Sphaerochaetaceae bacterium]
MKQSVFRLPYIMLLMVGILLFTLLSCNPEIDTPDPEPEPFSLLELGQPMTEARNFLETQGITEDDIHAVLLNYTIGFNRVATLVNSVIYADFEATDRNLLKQRVNAAIAELDAFNAICKDLEEIGTTLDSALDAYYDQFPDEQRKAMSQSSRAEEGDTWYARRLIELMLDYENPVTFDLNDISKRTGVGMKKLHYIMQQTANQLGTQVDIVDYEEYEKEIEYLETVRDTAGNINATLALATPLGAFTAGTTAAATTTGAHAVGWVTKAKTAYTVVENANAMITFTDGVVNLAVDEKDIPPAFKSVTKYNKYVGIALGGITGFKDVSTGEKIIGIVGAATDTTTTFFDINDGNVKVSETPTRTETPANVNTDSLQGVLPGGTYKVPNVDISSWEFPEFNWGDEELWEHLYDETLVGEAYDLFMDDLNQRFQDLIDTWDSTVNNDKLQEVLVDTSTLPEFFNLEDPDELFPEPEDVADDPDPAAFTIQVFASASSDTVPTTVTFTVVPSGAFLYGKTEFSWDFGDGSPLYKLEPGDAGYGSVVTHEYTEVPAGSSFTVSVTATDPRGYSASMEKTVSIRKTLQQLIDASTGSTLTIPTGTYTESIKVREGLTLTGSGTASTIIEGSVELEPDTALENLTVLGTVFGKPAIYNSYDVDTWADQISIDIDITDVVVENAPLVDRGIYFSDKWNEDYSDKIPYVGIIKNSLIKNCAESGIEIDYFDGEIRENVLENNGYQNIQIGKTTELAKISSNEIRGADSVGIKINDLRGIVWDNLIEDNQTGLQVSNTSQDAEVWENRFLNNGPIGAIVIDTMDGGSIHHNTITGNQRFGSYGLGTQGGGIQVDTMIAGASIANNTITANEGVAVYIRYLGNAAVTTGYDTVNGSVFANNIVQNNVATVVDTIQLTGGGVYIEYVYDGGVLGNIFSGNTTTKAGGGLYVDYLYGAVSGNTFTSNTAAERGGGASIGQIKESGTCNGNTFESNEIVSSTIWGSGGGLYVGTVDGQCNTNEATGNSISTIESSQGRGGGIFISGIQSTGSFSDNQITTNSTDYLAGGVCLVNLYSGATFTGNTISGNTAALNAGGCFVNTILNTEVQNEFDYKISETNSISGNNLTAPTD